MKALFALGALVYLGMTATGIPAVGLDDALIGVWVGQTMERDGLQASQWAARRMRFTFGKDTLTIKGNYRDEREDTCALVSDPGASPKQFNCTRPDKQLVLAIYEIRDDELRICLRHASFSGLGRPTTFATGPDSHLVLLVLKKQ